MVKKFLFACILVGCLNPSYGHQSVVVIPLGDSAKSVSNVIVVASKGGDFADPVTAISSIDDAGEDNPYLIYLAPGVFNIGENQLVMKPFVDIVGSGKKLSVIQGSVSGVGILAASALVIGANDSELRNLSIENQQGKFAFAIGLFNDGVTTTLESCEIRLSGAAGQQIGIRNSASSRLTMHSSSVFLSAGQGAQSGIQNAQSSAVLSNSIVEVVDGFDFQQGVLNFSGASSRILGSEIIVSGGVGAQIGVQSISNGASVELFDSVVRVENGGAFAAGVSHGTAADFSIIRNSKISGSNSSVQDFGAGEPSNPTYISDSILVGSVTGSPTCSFNFDGAGSELDSGCQAIP